MPAQVVVYYVLALTLYMPVSCREALHCLLEGIKWLLGPEWAVKVAGKSGISQARTRLGWEPLEQLHDEVVAPVAVKETKGARYGGWRLVSLDGSTRDVADTHQDEEAFGRRAASRGARATGADLLWRVKKNLRLPCEKRLPDGSYLSTIYPSNRD